MRIATINIHPTRTHETQITFHTEPALTEEVFAHFSLLVGNNPFTFTDGLLTTTRTDISAVQIAHTAEMLTEAEKHVANAKARNIQAREELLQHFSAQTGIPLANQKPPVS